MTITDWIQAISMIVLVIVTGIYAWRTHVISKATKEQALASVKMAKLIVKPRLIPFFRLTSEFDSGRYVRFKAGVSNVGSGPAYDIKAEIQDEGTPASILISGGVFESSGENSPVLLATRSAIWTMPDPRLYFPHSDEVQRRFLIIKYKDTDGEYEIRQPFVLETREGDKPYARLEGISRKLLRKVNLEDELP